MSGLPGSLVPLTDLYPSLVKYRTPRRHNPEARALSGPVLPRLCAMALWRWEGVITSVDNGYSASVGNSGSSPCNSPTTFKKSSWLRLVDSRRSCQVL